MTPEKNPHLFLIIFLGIGFFCILYLCSYWFNTLQIQSAQLFSYAQIDFRPEKFLDVRLKAKKEKPAKIQVKGLYLTAYSAANRQKLDSIIELIDKTELNSVVIDIKDYTGYVLYNSDLPIVNELKTEHNRLGDVRKIIEHLHNHGIYVIARQTVFQDPVLAERKSEWSIQSKLGDVWRDDKGLAWVDPTKKEVWEYNIAVAKEAISFGFDEINFDYVRFPSDGDMDLVVYNNKEQARYEVMENFFHYISDELENSPVWISIDMFGFVMERTDDMNIGQRLVDAVSYVDYICPMMYPSHYQSGHLGLENPSDSPEIVIQHGMELGIDKFLGKRAQVRPWLQAFSLGAIYDAEKIQVQTATASKYTEAGWLLWNASNRYSEAGLQIE